MAENTVAPRVCSAEPRRSEMTTPPDFYLTTAGEYEPLSAPRACRQRDRFHDELRDDYMLVDIDPPLPGQRFGLGGSDVTSLVFASRHRGQTLFPVSEWPSHVYVARVVDNEIPSADELCVQLIAWGAIFRSLREASDYAASVGRSRATCTSSAD
jgi:hypothetical protein